MIVKIVYHQEEADFQRLVECSEAEIIRFDNKFELFLFRDGEKSKSQKFDFESSVTVYFMEGGKTIDRFEFDPVVHETIDN